MGRVSAAEGNLREAEQRYREAIAIGDANFKNGHTITAEARYGLGMTLLASGRTQEAQAELERALEMLRSSSVTEGSLASEPWFSSARNEASASGDSGMLRAQHALAVTQPPLEQRLGLSVAPLASI